MSIRQSEQSTSVIAQNIVDLAMKGPKYHFNGSGDHILIPNTDIFNFGTEDFSILVGINPAVAAGIKTIFASSNSDSAVGLWFSLNGGRLYARIANTVVLTSTADALAVNVNAVVGICRGADGDLRGYVNGKEVVAGSNTTSISTAHDHAIGKAAGYTWNGTIAFVNIFDRKLNAVEWKTFLSGDVPFRDLGVNQDDLVTGTDSDMSGANNWVNNGFSVMDINTTVAGKMYVLGDGGSDYTRLGAGLTVGKMYKATLKARRNAGSQATLYFGSIVHHGKEDSNFAFTPTDVESTFTGTFLASDPQIRMGSSDLFGIAFEIDDVLVTRAGCVGQYKQSGIGHNQSLDTSGNELHGEADGANPVNLPANHIERCVKSSVTGDSLWADIVPMGYLLEKVVFEETAGNTAILDMGTSDGANDVFTGQTITASSITVIFINKMFSSSVAQTLDLNDDQAGSNWNSASVDVTFMMRRVK